MIEQIISFDQGYWIPDPQKLAGLGWMSAVIADRIGPEDIKKVIDATKTTHQNWNHYVQDGIEIIPHQIDSVIEDFSKIGSKYYMNQFIEHKKGIAFWAPDFSEFSLVMFKSDFYSELAEFLLDTRKTLEDWVNSDFWTVGERDFIIDGIKKYTILPTG